MNKTALIIGGGFAGCAAAHQLQLLGGWDVTLVEKSSYLGAGNKTRWYGGHPYTFGPRHFLTTYPETYEYINKILPIRLCPEHEFLTYVESDNSFYSYPINSADIPNMPDSNLIQDELDIEENKKRELIENASNFEEYWVASIGQRLYGKFINQYTKKMWQVESNTEIDTFSWSPKGATLKHGPRAAWDCAISGYPYAADGYDGYFPIATEGSKVIFNTMAKLKNLEKKCFEIDGVSKQFDLVVNTIGPDVLMDNELGALKYLGRKLNLMVFPTEDVFPKDVYFLYYANSEEFTRLVEYKKFTKHKSSTSLVGMEIPVNNGGYDYPMPFKDQQKLASKYFEMMPDNFYSIGRAGSYLYGIDIDDCIRQALVMAEQIKEGSYEYPVPGKEYQFPELN
tara:strand:+ start:3194 stop:4381 length:1188 start_codon:yes stop_codon:yes gene_type:complete